MSLSILIPVFNYDCRKLITDLHLQVSELNIDFEIRVYDDCSTNPELKKQSSEIQFLHQVNYKALTKNLGFCKIRNVLADDAQYENLLFLDSDIEIPEGFIAKYLKDTSTDVQIGGIIYTAKIPHDKNLYLKWKHGKEREELTIKQRNKNPYRTISAANIFVKKKVYLKAKMDEKSTGYGYNDTMLGYNFKLINATINHIDNPVLHEGLMSAAKFINRSMEAMRNLVFFENQHYIKSDFKSFIKVLKVYKLLKKTGFANWYLSYFKNNKERWIINLKSENPNLRNLDKLKLGELIKLKGNR